MKTVTKAVEGFPLQLMEDFEQTEKLENGQKRTNMMRKITTIIGTIIILEV